MANPNNLLGLPEAGAPPPVAVKPDGTSEAAERYAGDVTAASQAAVAPWPLIDRYPTILGSNLSLQYLSSVYRLCLTGYRREYVDALNEILERDPHLYAVLMQRVLTACGARIMLTPSNPDSLRSRKICEEVQRQIDGLVEFRQALVCLALSGMYYGLGASEITWERTLKGGWRARRLHFIHSRRLNYPDPGSWDLRIWDQGQMWPWDGSGTNPVDVTKTAKLFGIRVSDYPGKFVVFQPQLRADYATRDGLGRQVAMWSVLKAMGARGAAQFVERYCKPWAIATYTTTPDGKPRAAEVGGAVNDVSVANAALQGLGTGSLAGAVLPDSIKLELQQITGAANNLGHKDFIELCNKEMSKGILGQTDTTDGGKSGSKARAETQKTGSDQLARFDVMLLADALQSGLVDWIVRLNYPNDFDKRPKLTMLVDPDPDPKAILQLADMAARIGMPVDADATARLTGLKLVDPEDPEARQLAPISNVDIATLQPKRFVAQPDATQAAVDDAALPDAAKPDAPGRKDDDESDDATAAPSPKRKPAPPPADADD